MKTYNIYIVIKCLIYLLDRLFGAKQNLKPKIEYRHTF